MAVYEIENGWNLVSFINSAKCHSYIIHFLDTKASEKMTDIITNKTLCQDIQKLSTSYQTSRLEAFHSVVINFAPKLTAFSYLGMKSR